MSDSHGIAEILLKVAFKTNKIYYHGETKCNYHTIMTTTVPL
jgi:hypothetical protein